MSKLQPGCLLMLWALAAAGCATVDPQPDYQRAGEYIQQSTGQVSVQPLQDDSVVQEHVAALMEGGITLDEAVKLCLLNNPAFQATWYEIGMARADLVQSGLLSNPSLGVALRFPAGGGLANLEMGVAQNVAELWQIPYRKQEAERDLDRAIIELAIQATDLAADTRTAYAKAVGAGRLHRIQQDNLSIAKELLRMILARKEAGAATELDINLSRNVVLEAELAVESSRLAWAEALRTLAVHLGLETEASGLELLDPLAAAPFEVLDAEHLLQLARSSRLDIKAARQAVAAAEARLLLQYRLVFPNLEVGVALERAERQSEGGRDLLADTARASVANGALTGPEIEPGSRKSTNFVIGPSLDLELPVFDQNQAQIAKARYAHQQAGKMLEALSRAVTQEVRSAVDRATTASKAARVCQEQSVPLAERSLELSRESYQAGKVSVLSVLEAQRFLLDSRRRQTLSAVEAATALTQVERAVGVPMSQIRPPLEPFGEDRADNPETTDGGKP